MRLPPDPDGKNDHRAGWADKALVAFQTITEADSEDVLSDLLTDLMHWSDRIQMMDGASFENELERAREHYKVETMNDDGSKSIYNNRAREHYLRYIR